MNAIVGPLAKGLHLLLLSVLVLSGLSVLLMASLSYMWLVAVLVTAPLWTTGLVAAAELIRAMRGRPVTVARAGAWTLALMVGAAMTASVMLWGSNRPGAGFALLDQPSFLLSTAVLGIGVATLLVLWRERSRRAEV